jgi:glycosyltransferase involved in cell wall biosynthesis
VKLLAITSYYKPAYVYGGPVKSLSQLFEALAAYGHEVVVYTTNANGNSNFAAQEITCVTLDGVSVFYFNRNLGVPKRYFFSSSLGNKCKSEINKFDIVYICGTWTYPFLPAAKYAKLFNVPYILSPRGSFMERAMETGRLKKRIYFNLFEKTLINQASCIHCTGLLELEQIKKWGFKPPLVSIANIVDLEPFRNLPVRGKLRVKLRIPEDAPVTLFVGRLQKIKQLDLIIQKFSEVSKRISDAHFIIVGPDEDNTGVFCKELVSILNLQNKVHFVGQLQGEDLLQAYSDSDLLVLLSKSESFGNVAAEAMAAGLPIIVGKGVGISSFIKDSNAGTIIDMDDPDFISVWCDFCANPEKRKKMGICAKSLALDKFSANSISGQMTDLFVKILDSNRSKNTKVL